MWCASPLGPNPNISLTFSQPVLITGFIPGGFSNFDGSNKDYVTNFNLRYSESLNENTFSSPQVRHSRLAVLTLETEVFYDILLCAGVHNLYWQPGSTGDVWRPIPGPQTTYTSEQLCYCDRWYLHGHGHIWLSSLWRYSDTFLFPLLKTVDALSVLIPTFSYPGSTAQQLSLCDTRGHPGTAVSPVSGGEGLPGTGHCPAHSTDHNSDHSSYCRSGRGTLYQGESQREGAQVRIINLVPKLSDELE